MLKPTFGHNYRLILSGVQPRPPPAKRTVANDVVAAMAHQHHVLPAFRTFIPINEDGLWQRQVFLTQAMSSEKT